jgi:hypothetical protein
MFDATGSHAERDAMLNGGDNVKAPPPPPVSSPLSHSVKLNFLHNLSPFSAWKFLVFAAVILGFTLFADIVFLAYAVWEEIDTSGVLMNVAYMCQFTGWVSIFCAAFAFTQANVRSAPAFFLFYSFIAWLTGAWLQTTRLSSAAWNVGAVQATFTLRWIALFVFVAYTWHMFVRMTAAYHTVRMSATKLTDRLNSSVSAFEIASGGGGRNKVSPTVSGMTALVPNARVQQEQLTLGVPGALASQSAELQQLRARLHDLSQDRFEIQRLRRELFEAHQYISQLKITAYNAAGVGANVGMQQSHANGGGVRIEQVDTMRSGAETGGGGASAQVQALQDEVMRLRGQIAAVTGVRGDAAGDDVVRDLQLHVARLQSEKLALAESASEQLRAKDQQLLDATSVSSEQKIALGQLDSASSYNSQQVAKLQELHDAKHAALEQTHRTLGAANQRINELTARLSAEQKMADVGGAAAAAADADAGGDDDDADSDASSDDDEPTQVERHKATFLAMREAVENLRVQLQDAQAEAEKWQAVAEEKLGQ